MILTFVFGIVFLVVSGALLKLAEEEDSAVIASVGVVACIGGFILLCITVFPLYNVNHKNALTLAQNGIQGVVQDKEDFESFLEKESYRLAKEGVTIDIPSVLEYIKEE